MSRPTTRDSRRGVRLAARSAPLGALLLAILLAACGVQSTALMMDAPTLACRLGGEESYPAGETALFEFEIENRSERTLFVLGWHTPLEGIRNRIFKVSREGEELEYQGMMARRGDPVADDYVEIAAGESATASFDLAVSYDLSRPGEYRLEFTSRVMDLVFDRSQVPRPLAEQRPAELDCNELTFRIEG